MPTYRCFCMTAEDRILTGARLKAPNLAALSAIAAGRWHTVPGFHHVEIWLGPHRLSPETTPAGEPPSADAVSPGARVVPRSQLKLDLRRASNPARATVYVSWLNAQL